MKRTDPNNRKNNGSSAPFLMAHVRRPLVCYQNKNHVDECARTEKSLVAAPSSDLWVDKHKRSGNQTNIFEGNRKNQGECAFNEWYSMWSGEWMALPRLRIARAEVDHVQNGYAACSSPPSPCASKSYFVLVEDEAQFNTSCSTWTLLHVHVEFPRRQFGSFGPLVQAHHAVHKRRGTYQNRPNLACSYVLVRSPTSDSQSLPSRYTLNKWRALGSSIRAAMHVVSMVSFPYTKLPFPSSRTFGGPRSVRAFRFVPRRRLVFRAPDGYFLPCDWSLGGRGSESCIGIGQRDPSLRGFATCVRPGCPTHKACAMQRCNVITRSK